MKDTKIIKFTIPDVSPTEQIKMIKSMKSVTKAMAKLTGENVDLKPFDDAIAKIQGDIEYENSWK